MDNLKILGDNLLKHVSNSRYSQYEYKDETIQIEYFLREYVREFNTLDIDDVNDLNYIANVFEKVYDFLPSLLDIPSSVCSEFSCERMTRYFKNTIVMSFPIGCNKDLNIKTQHLERLQTILDSTKKFISKHDKYELSGEYVDKTTELFKLYEIALFDNYRRYVYIHKLKQRQVDIN